MADHVFTRKGQEGFSLVEVLVVLALLALAVVILLKALLKTKGDANKTAEAKKYKDTINDIDDFLQKPPDTSDEYVNELLEKGNKVAELFEDAMKPADDSGLTEDEKKIKEGDKKKKGTKCFSFANDINKYVLEAINGLLEGDVEENKDKIKGLQELEEKLKDLINKWSKKMQDETSDIGTSQ